MSYDADREAALRQYYAMNEAGYCCALAAPRAVIDDVAFLIKQLDDARAKVEYVQGQLEEWKRHALELEKKT